MYYYKLSLILPIYNVEKYIVKCFNSIINSDLPKGEYEVVLVNDGSIDRSGDIAREYAAKYENWKYLEQSNQSQSIARNNGIRASSGEYIWCIDPDDVLCPNLNYIFNFLKEHPDVDIIKTVIKTFDEGQPVVYEQLDGSHTLKTGRELLLNNYHPSSVCNMIVRKSIILENDLKLIKGIVSEDAEFSHRLYSFAMNVYTFNYITYLYIHNSSSTTQSKDYFKIINKDLSNITVSKSFQDFSKSISNRDPELSQFFYNRSKSILLGMLLTMINKRKERKGTDINQKVLEEMKKQGTYPLNGKFDTFKKRIVVSILNKEFLLRRMI